MKVRTYAVDTIMIPCDTRAIPGWDGNHLGGRLLYHLCEQALMLLEAQPKLRDVAEESGVHFFCRPLDNLVADRLKTLRVGARRERNVGSIRHRYGLRSLNVEQIAGHREASSIGGGIPLDWGLVVG